MQRRRSNTVPFQSSTRMFTAVEGEDGTELLSDDYPQSPDHVFQTKASIIEAKDDGYVEQSLDIPSVSVKVDPPETTTTPDQNQDGDLSDLAKNGLPSACIFVAKYVSSSELKSSLLIHLRSLAASQTDDQLMKSLQGHFRQFGRLHVKIRRDSKGNPYSFCQFEVSYVRSSCHAFLTLRRQTKLPVLQCATVVMPSSIALVDASVASLQRSIVLWFCRNTTDPLPRKQKSRS